MKVKNLIEQLQQHNQEADVKICIDMKDEMDLTEFMIGTEQGKIYIDVNTV